AGGSPCGGRGTRPLQAVSRPACWELRRKASTTRAGLLRTEQHAVHDPPRDEREYPGDDQRTGESQDHDAAVIGHTVTVRHPCPDWKHHQREDRQQVNRAPRTYESDLEEPG